MKPVDQTQFGQNGNCFSASLASLLEVQLSDVPAVPVVADQPERWDIWTTRYAEWLLSQFDLVMFDFPASWPLRPTGYHEMSGPSGRGFNHSVVGLDGEVVHDPHPSRKGLLKVEHYLVLVPLGWPLQRRVAYTGQLEAAK